MNAKTSSPPPAVTAVPPCGIGPVSNTCTMPSLAAATTRGERVRHTRSCMRVAGIRQCRRTDEAGGNTDHRLRVRQVAEGAETLAVLPDRRSLDRYLDRRDERIGPGIAAAQIRDDLLLFPGRCGERGELGSRTGCRTGTEHPARSRRSASRCGGARDSSTARTVAWMTGSIWSLSTALADHQVLTSAPVAGLISTLSRSPAQPGSIVGSKMMLFWALSTWPPKAAPERDLRWFWMPDRMLAMPYDTSIGERA